MAYPWWETVSLLKKLFLMGFINVLTDTGTTTQLTVAFLTANTFLVLHLLLKPWRDSASHMLEAVASFALACLFFGSFLLSIGNFADTIESTAGGQALPKRYLRASYISYGGISAFLFLVSLSVIACAVAQLVWRPTLAVVRSYVAAFCCATTPKRASQAADHAAKGGNQPAAGEDERAYGIGLVGHWLAAALLQPAEAETPVNLFKLSAQHYASYREQIAELVWAPAADEAIPSAEGGECGHPQEARSRGEGECENEMRGECHLAAANRTISADLHRREGVTFAEEADPQHRAWGRKRSVFD